MAPTTMVKPAVTPQPPFSVRRIDHVVFRVASLERSVAFYRAVVGCEVVRERHDLGLVHLRAGTSMIDLVSVDGRLGVGGGPAPENFGAEGSGLSLYFTDPDGNVIEIKDPSVP